MKELSINRLDVLEEEYKNDKISSITNIATGIIVKNIESFLFSIDIATNSDIIMLITRSWILNCPISLLPINLNTKIINI